MFNIEIVDKIYLKYSWQKSAPSKALSPVILKTDISVFIFVGEFFSFLSGF